MAFRENPYPLIRRYFAPNDATDMTVVRRTELDALEADRDTWQALAEDYCRETDRLMSLGVSTILLSERLLRANFSEEIAARDTMLLELLRQHHTLMLGQADASYWSSDLREQTLAVLGVTDATR